MTSRNVVVLGASGGCGKALVDLALRRGHRVTAVVRSQQYVAPTGCNARVGSIFDAAFLADALRGQDVVLSGLGLRMGSIAPWARPEMPDVLSRSTPLIIEAMKTNGIQRAGIVSAGGVGDSFAMVPGVFRFMIRNTGLRHAYRELEVMERLWLQSGLDVCLARPTGLTDGPETGDIKVCTAFTGRATISRADVARFLLDGLDAPAWPGRTPMITVTGAASPPAG